MAHREHVPAKAFSPGMAAGYRSDISSSHPKMAPIALGGQRVSDILAQGARIISGASDQVFNKAPYGVIKLYVTWPGYAASDLFTIDLYAGGSRATRASIAMEAARRLCKYFESCKSHKIHPTAAKWFIGERGLSARNVIFNYLVNTYENVWQIDCDVVI